MNNLFKKILITCTLLGFLGLIIFVGFIVYSNYHSKSSELTTSKEPITYGHKITALPSTNLEKSFTQNDFESILAFIASKTPDSNWLQNMGGVTEIEFIDKIPNDPYFSQRTAVTALDKVTLCGYFPNDCENMNPNKPHIFLNSDMKKYQPYSLSSILMHEIRHVYNYINNQRGQCIPEEVDAYTWAAKYWGSLTPKEREHLDGFSDELARDENIRLQSYQDGTLLEKVEADYKSICK